MTQKFIPGFGPKKTVASVTNAFQKTIADLLSIENESNAEHDVLDAQIVALANKQSALLEEAEKAAKVRVKLEALLS